MKMFTSLIVVISMICSTSILPYIATQKGIVVEAHDCARTPNAMCLEAPLSEQVQNYIGKGITASTFMANGLRPVTISITNKSDKPMILAPFYGMKMLDCKGRVDVLTGSMILPKIAPLIAAAVLCGYFTVNFGVVAIAAYNATPLFVTMSLLSAIGCVAATSRVVVIDTMAKQFNIAMTEKFEELNYKDEVLIMPGKTVKKLLISQNEAYISRFPLVVYPLEDRPNSIVFDVDLRTIDPV